MDWVVVSLVAAPVLALAGMVLVLRVLARVGRDVQRVAEHLEAYIEAPPDREG